MSVDYCQLSVARIRKSNQFSEIAIFMAENHFVCNYLKLILQLITNNELRTLPDCLYLF